MPSTLNDILGPDGAIARRLGERYEPRPQQLEMADAVARRSPTAHHLLVEAGTGVGKSFAYLLPAIDYAVKHKKRVVISTHTISLQEQLIDKDIPLIQAVYPDEFTAVLVKGRSNYLCQRRLEQARQRQNVFSTTIASSSRSGRSRSGRRRPRDGSLADLPTVPDPGVWDKVCAEHGNCLGKKCQHFDSCFWQAAKRRMQGGNILVVNHALFFSDLALRMAGVNYLPKYDAVIFDEAHTIEDVAGQHFGLKLSEAGICATSSACSTTRSAAAGCSACTARRRTTRSATSSTCRRSAKSSSSVASTGKKKSAAATAACGNRTSIENDAAPKLHDLAKHIKAMLPELNESEETEPEAMELSNQADRSR